MVPKQEAVQLVFPLLYLLHFFQPQGINFKFRIGIESPEKFSTPFLNLIMNTYLGMINLNLGTSS